MSNINKRSLRFVILVLEKFKIATNEMFNNDRVKI